jgi:hypothetical protein
MWPSVWVDWVIFLGIASDRIGRRQTICDPPAGLQMIIPGCERRTLPRSTTCVDEIGQGLLRFYKPPSLREKLKNRADAPLRPRKGQKPLPDGSLFSS